jgi:hypothetical protein
MPESHYSSQYPPHLPSLVVFPPSLTLRLFQLLLWYTRARVAVCIAVCELYSANEISGHGLSQSIYHNRHEFITGRNYPERRTLHIRHSSAEQAQAFHNQQVEPQDQLYSTATVQIGLFMKGNWFFALWDLNQ